MDVMDYFSDRVVTFSSDGATELDASFLSFPRSAGLAGPSVLSFISRIGAYAVTRSSELQNFSRGQDFHLPISGPELPGSYSVFSPLSVYYVFSGESFRVPGGRGSMKLSFNLRVAQSLFRTRWI